MGIFGLASSGFVAVIDGRFWVCDSNLRTRPKNSRGLNNSTWEYLGLLGNFSDRPHTNRVSLSQKFPFPKIPSLLRLALTPATYTCMPVCVHTCARMRTHARTHARTPPLLAHNPATRQPRSATHQHVRICACTHACMHMQGAWCAAGWAMTRRCCCATAATARSAKPPRPKRP